VKLSLKHYDVTHSVEHDDDALSLPDIVEQLITPLLLSLGFSEAAVNRALEGKDPNPPNNPTGANT
jgi:hypothetical protein